MFMQLMCVNIPVREAALCLLLSAALVEAAPLALTEEHVDVALAYPATTPSGWRLYWNNKDNGQEHDSASAFARGGAQAQISRPVGSTWDFTGVAAGQPLFVLPQSQNPSLPFLGIGAEGVAASTFVGPINLRLTAVSGPGAFSLFQTDVFGGLTPFMASADGITAADTLSVSAGSHVHYAWSFTQPGTYDLTFVASATLPGGSLTTSDPEMFRFVMVPEPSTSTLAMIVACGGAIALQRRRVFLAAQPPARAIPDSRFVFPA
jgi:surface-anchored protein